jgi:RNA-directed DNA polymerase
MEKAILATKKLLDRSGVSKGRKYHSFEIPKKSGGTRQIDAPEKWLKGLQRMRLQDIYNRTPRPYYAHGFEKRRGIVTNARVHCGQRYVVNLDLKDFFPSCNTEKADGMRRRLGMESWEYSYNNALPQGSPLSPAIANRIMDPLDSFIHSILKKYTSSDIRYTRYADDITLSSNSRAVFFCIELVEKILNNSGFKLNDKKTRRMGPAGRQEVTGLVINSGKPTIRKKYRKEVRAAVHNATKAGISPGELETLKGRIGFIAMCHRAEAKKLNDKLKTARTI